MLSYFVIYYEKFWKVMQRTEKGVLIVCLIGVNPMHMSRSLLKFIKGSLRFYWYMFHNSLIIHGNIYQMVYGQVDVYVLLFKSIKSEMKQSRK